MQHALQVVVLSCKKRLETCRPLSEGQPNVCAVSVIHANLHSSDSSIINRLTILIKLPEIIVFVYFTLISPSSSGIGIVLVYPDAAISNILAAKIYRNMKLKRPGILPVRRSGNNGTFATHPTISLSLPQFASPMDSDNDIPLTKINARASSWHQPTRILDA